MHNSIQAVEKFSIANLLRDARDEEAQSSALQKYQVSLLAVVMVVMGDGSYEVVVVMVVRVTVKVTVVAVLGRLW